MGLEVLLCEWGLLVGARRGGAREVAPSLQRLGLDHRATTLSLLQDTKLHAVQYFHNAAFLTICVLFDLLWNFGNFCVRVCAEQ